MGLLDRLKLNKTKDFFEWLDLILKNELNSEIKAINFNLYEDTDNKWSVELVGTFSFDKDNDDWTCVCSFIIVFIRTGIMRFVLL